MPMMPAAQEDQLSDATSDNLIAARSGSAPVLLGNGARNIWRATLGPCIGRQMSTSLSSVGATPEFLNASVERALAPYSRGLSEDLCVPAEQPTPVRMRPGELQRVSMSLLDTQNSYSDGTSAPLPQLLASSPFSGALSLSSSTDGELVLQTKPTAGSRLSNCADVQTVNLTDAQQKTFENNEAVEGNTSHPVDLMGMVSKVLAQGLSLNDMLDGLSTCTKHSNVEQQTSAGATALPDSTAAGPTWPWPPANAAAGAAPAAAAWEGMWVGTEVAASLPGSGDNGTHDKSSAFAGAAAGCLSQEQLLPAHLLFSSRNSPSPNSGNWARPSSPAGSSSPNQADSSRQPSVTNAPKAGRTSPVHVEASNDLAGSKRDGSPGVPLSTSGVEMLSTALEKLRPDELEMLAAMDLSQFEQLMYNAVASLATPQEAAAAVANTPAMARAFAAGSSRLGPSGSASPAPSVAMNMQQLQALAVQREQLRLQQQQQQQPIPQQGLTSRQLQALLQAYPLAQDAHGGGSHTNGYPAPLAPPSPFPAAMPAMYHMGGHSRGAGLAPQPAQRATPCAAVGEGTWEELTQTVRDKVHNMAIRCEPHIKLSHFDGGVRHWLAQLTSLFGESAALSGLATIEQATNLAGVRNMRAFITTRLIDCFEQHIFKRDPAGYAARRLLPEQFSLLEELVSSGQGLQWTHFDPKVLDTVRDLGSLDYTRARLSRLSARELASVQNVPAYIFTLLSKRGKTAKQAAAAKGASEAALTALLDATLMPHPNSHSPTGSMHVSPSLRMRPGMTPMNGIQLTPAPDASHMQRSWTLGHQSGHNSSFFNSGGSAGGLSDMLSQMQDGQFNGGVGNGGYLCHQQMPTRSMSTQPGVGQNMQQQYNWAAAQLAMLQQRQQVFTSSTNNPFHWC